MQKNMVDMSVSLKSEMVLSLALFVPIFRGKSRSLVFLHSFPEGFRSGRHRKGAEMNQKNTEIDTSTMGGRILALRLQKGWSQEELGFRIGVNNKSVISFYENNSRAVSLPVLQMLSREFGTTLDYLVNGTEPALNEMDPDILMAIKLLKDLKTEKGRKVAIEHIRLVGMLE